MRYIRCPGCDEHITFLDYHYASTTYGCYDVANEDHSDGDTEGGGGDFAYSCPSCLYNFEENDIDLIAERYGTDDDDEEDEEKEEQTLDELLVETNTPKTYTKPKVEFMNLFR